MLNKAHLKISREEMFKIKEMRDGGMMLKDIAKMYGVIPTTIARRLKGVK